MSRIWTLVIAVSVAAILLPGTAAAAPPEYRRFDQDPKLDNLVHPPGYRTAAPGTLGRVEKVGHGPRSMVLIAGATFGGEIFKGFMEARKAQFTMYAVTLPGSAGTPAPPMPPPGTSYGERTWMKGVQTAIERLIETEKLHAPILVGHWIIGADVALRIALDRPELIGGAVLVSAVTKWPLPPPVPATLEQRVAMVDKGLAPQWFRTVTADTWDDNNFLPRDYARHPVLGQRLWRQAESVPLPVKIRYALEARTQDLTLELPRLKVPVLSLVPEFDAEFFAGPYDSTYMKWFCHDGWNGLEATAPRLQLVRIPQSRVFIMDDEPEAFDAALARFLGPIAPARSAVAAVPPERRPVDRVAFDLPGKEWRLETEGLQLPAIGRLLHSSGAARGVLSLQPVPEAPLTTLVPALEQAMAAKYSGFKKLDSAIESIDGRDVFQIDCEYDEEGARWRGAARFTRTDDGLLFGLSFRVEPERLQTLRADLDRIAAGLRIDGHRLGPLAARQHPGSR